MKKKDVVARGGHLPLKLLNKTFVAICSIAAAAFAFNAGAQTNIIEDQTNWPDGEFVNSVTNSPQTNDLPASSYWYSGKSTEFNGTNGTLVIAPIPAGSSFTCWTYFAPSNAPVTLSPGYTIQMTLNFTVYGTGAENASRHLRFGLLYSGPNQFTNDGTAPGLGVVGYAQQMDFGTEFGEAPLQTVADTNINDAVSVFSKSADFIQIGDNGGGNTNDPGFTDGVPYTAVMSISEVSTSQVSITTTFLGSTLTNGMITQTVTDTNYCYTNFDTFCFRPNDGATTATNFTFTGFEVATFPTPGAAGPISTSIKAYPPNTIVLSWNSTQGATYSVLRTNNLAAPLVNWKSIVTGLPAGASGGTIYYTDRPAGAIEFYRVTSP